jgi:hypothetical protein
LFAAQPELTTSRDDLAFDSTDMIKPTDTYSEIVAIRDLHERALAAHFAFEVKKLTLDESGSQLRKTLTYLQVVNEPPAPVSLRLYRDDNLS